MGIIARQSIKGTIATYIGVAVGFFTTFFVLTRFLTTEEVGLARVLLDAATLFVGLAQIGTSASVIRFFPYFNDKQSLSAHGFFFWAFLIPLFGFILFAFLFWVARMPVAAWFSEKSPLFVDYYYLVLPIAFFMLYQTVAETCSNVCMRIVVPRTVREVVVRIGLLIAYLAYAFRWLSIDGFVWALCGNYAVAALIDIGYFLAVCPFTIRCDMAFLRKNKTVVRNYLFYTAFLIASALASVLAPALSSFFITAKMGLSFTGIFAIATYMAVMVSIPYRSLTAIAAPQLADAIKQQDREQTQQLLQQVTTNAFVVGCLILLLLWVNIDFIYLILPNGTVYAQARDAVFILALSQLSLATFSFTLSALNYGRYYAFSLLFSAMLTISAILLNNCLIPRYGMLGAAWSNLLSYAIYFALIVFTVHRTMHLTPFHRKQAILLLLMGGILAVNSLSVILLPFFTTGWGSVLRCVLFTGMFVYGVYRWKIAPEILSNLHALFYSLFVSRH